MCPYTIGKKKPSARSLHFTLFFAVLTPAITNVNFPTIFWVSLVTCYPFSSSCTEVKIFSSLLLPWKTKHSITTLYIYQQFLFFLFVIQDEKKMTQCSFAKHELEINLHMNLYMHSFSSNILKTFQNYPEMYYDPDEVAIVYIYSTHYKLVNILFTIRERVALSFLVRNT